MSTSLERLEMWWNVYTGEPGVVNGYRNQNTHTVKLTLPYQQDLIRNLQLIFSNFKSLAKFQEFKAKSEQEACDASKLKESVYIYFDGFAKGNVLTIICKINLLRVKHLKFNKVNGFNLSIKISEYENGKQVGKQEVGRQNSNELLLFRSDLKRGLNKKTDDERRERVINSLSCLIPLGVCHIISEYSEYPIDDTLI